MPPKPDPAEQAEVTAQRDRMIAELHALRRVLEQGEKARQRRLEVWVALRDLSTGQQLYAEEDRVPVTQALMAQASGTSEAGVSLALRRYDKLQAEKERQDREDG